MTRPGAGEPVGTLAEEAARLAEAAAGWVRGEGAGPASAAAGHMATGEAACCVCPLCLVIATVRGERPDLAARMGQSLGALLAAGQDVVATMTAAAAEGRAATGPRRPTDPGRPAADDDRGSDPPGASPPPGRPGPADAPAPPGEATASGSPTRVQPIPLD